MVEQVTMRGTAVAPVTEMYINDHSSLTVQQVFRRSCISYSPLERKCPGLLQETALHNCEDCGDQFLFASSLNFHMNRYSVKVKFWCKHCSRHLDFYNRCNFLAHLRLHNTGLCEEELARLDISSQPIPSESIPDNFRITNFFDQQPLDEVQQANVQSCVECKVVLNKGTSLLNHYVGEGKPGNPELACNKCNFILPTKCALSAHQRIHTRVQPFICPDCSVTFLSWTSLLDHLTSVCYHRYKFVRYKCSSCCLFFSKSEDLYSHIVVLHMKCLLPMCKECPPFIKLHIGTDKPKSMHPLLCQVCNKMVSVAKFKFHVLAHAQNKTAKLYVFKCVKCNFTTEDRLSFSRHGHTKKMVTKKQQPQKTFIFEKMYPQKKDVISPQSIFKQTTTNVGSESLEDSVTELDVDQMPLTPSPEPVTEEDPLLLDSTMPHQNIAKVVRTEKTNTCAIPKAFEKKNIVLKSGPMKLTLIKPKPRAASNQTISAVKSPTRKFTLVKADAVKMVDTGFPVDPDRKCIRKSMSLLASKVIHDKPVMKRFKCSKCKELILSDGTAMSLQNHFVEKHPELKICNPNKADKNSVSGRKIIFVTKKNENGSTDKGITAFLAGSKPKGSDKIQAPKTTPTFTFKHINRNDANIRLSVPVSSAAQNNCSPVELKKKECKKKTLKRIPDEKEDVDETNVPDVLNNSLVKVENSLLEEDAALSAGQRLKRKRRKKTLDPDFVSNDSDLEEKLKETRVAVKKTLTKPPKEQVKKRPMIHDDSQEVCSKTKKYKKKHSIQIKTASPEALGSGLVIPSTDSDSKNVFVCALPDCSFSNENKDVFREHVLTHRTEKNLYQCLECGLCFVVKPTFTKHLFIQHQISDAELYILNNNCCDEGMICREIDFTDYATIQLGKFPTVLQEFQCTSCYKPCVSELDLTNHVRTHGRAYLGFKTWKKFTT